MTAKALLDKNPHPTDAQIRESMNGTLCRCMSYFRVQSAIKRAIKIMAETSPAAGKKVVASACPTEFPNRLKTSLFTITG